MFIVMTYRGLGVLLLICIGVAVLLAILSLGGCAWRTDPAASTKSHAEMQRMIRNDARALRNFNWETDDLGSSAPAQPPLQAIPVPAPAPVQVAKKGATL